jgi:hypothetical protein
VTADPALSPALDVGPVPRASGEAAVLVIGMHRSGTSATTGLLAHLGLAVTDPRDLLTASRTANERGHWESQALLRFNIRLMRRLGGTWSTPPGPSLGWERDQTLDSWRREGRQLVDELLPNRPSVWKDPRNCVLLPFWRAVLAPPLAAVLILRDPLEVARSLQTRNAMPLTYGMAVWERHLRAAAVALDGIPTIAGDYAATLEDPASWCDRLTDFLGDVGVALDPAGHADAARFLDAGLRHHRAPEADRSAVPASTERVWERLRQRVGIHLPWTDPDLGAEPGWVDDVLVVARRAEEAKVEQVALRRSRAYRFARSVTELRSRLPWS